jgi:hypothetical protein
VNYLIQAIKNHLSLLYYRQGTRTSTVKRKFPDHVVSGMEQNEFPETPTLGWSGNFRFTALAAMSLIEKGKKLAENGQVEEAIEQFTQAQKMDERFKFGDIEDYALRLSKK